MQPTIQTIDFGNIPIVNPNSKKYYLKYLALIEDCEGNYYEVWRHYNGYNAAIPIED